MAEIRLQKILASSGCSSRRKCEELIKSGRVSVNGIVVDTPGTKVDPDVDKITVDGKPITSESPVYVMLNKPAGCLSAMEDTRGRPTVKEYISGVGEKVFHIGRLDFDTEGLLLFTNDGDFSQRVTHPSHKIFKTYQAVVEHVPEEKKLGQLRSGIILDDGPTAPAYVKLLAVEKAAIPNKKNPRRPAVSSDVAILEIRIREGRKRQVRRMFGAIGHPVISLKRTRIGGLSLGDLPAGKWRRLSPKEAMLALAEEAIGDE